jgi:choline dehydrogenase
MELKIFVLRMGSVIPRITTGNTMAVCGIIGERAAELIRRTCRI